MKSYDSLVEELFKLSRIIKEEMAQSSEVVHLSFLQLQALNVIKQGKNIQMNEIAGHFRIELSSATSLINTLSKMGLVQRKKDSKDRRVVRIVLSKKGEKILNSAMKQREKAVKRIVFCLSNSERKHLFQVVKKLTEKFGKNHEK